MRARRALEEFPLKAEQIPEEVVAPLSRGAGPDSLQTAGDRVATYAGAEGILPAEALLLDQGTLGFGAAMRVGGRAVSLAEGVPAGNQGHGLLVIHRHAGERLANIARRGDGIGISVGSLRIHVNQAHLHSAERIVELPVAGVALVAEPRLLGSPVSFIGFPDVRAPAAKTKGL